MKAHVPKLLGDAVEKQKTLLEYRQTDLLLNRNTKSLVGIIYTNQLFCYAKINVSYNH